LQLHGGGGEDGNVRVEGVKLFDRHKLPAPPPEEDLSRRACAELVLTFERGHFWRMMEVMASLKGGGADDYLDVVEVDEEVARHDGV
jgi:hypothetical protein